MARYYDFSFPPPSVPRKAKGGIKARSQRGAFGARWWSRRWVEVLDGFHIGARLARGRKYARQGQVTDIQVEEGRVTAKVQGSRTRPYDVTIGVKKLSGAEWKKVGGRLGREALYAAKLMAGEMPDEIETVFAAVGHSLFPSTIRDLTTDCSCPDWSNPCKHIAAVYYLLGEEFDRDPFLIFQLRGMGRSGLLDLLHQGTGGRGKKDATRKAGNAVRAEAPTAASAAPAPLPSDPGTFWGSSGEGAALPALPPTEGGNMVARGLGSFPFWRGREAFIEAMDRSADAASAEGVRVLARLAGAAG